MTARRDSTTRFSDRVDDYIRYRPRYPAEVLDALREHAGLDAGSVVADVGSGTGIFSELLLRSGATVLGIEPNREMRRAADELLAGEPRYRGVNGTAERTTLESTSVDLVAAAQAFHWFDPVSTRAEFTRILRPGGKTALVWNSRKTRATPFLSAYEDLLREFGTDYTKVDHLNVTPQRIAEFFGRPAMRITFPNVQRLDFAGLQGRLLSSSYTPAAGSPEREAMLLALRRIHAEHAAGGFAEILYETELYIGTFLNA